jgi:CheY-like chemotaxis protein
MPVMKKRILVVDDEDIQRDLLKKLLSKSGYSVEVAESPEVAFSLMKQEDFPVIITDLIMLDMDGVEFCQRIRERNFESIIIALTGYADLYDLGKLKRVGFDNYVTKPIKLNKILPVVESGFKKIREREKALKKRKT